jgi:hypothetical protein
VRGILARRTQLFTSWRYEAMEDPGA